MVLAASLLTGVVTLAPVPAKAFEFFGWTFFESSEPQEQAVPDPLAYTPVITVLNGNAELKPRLEAASALFTQRETLPSGEAGLISRALGDRDRLVARLYEDGYYGGTLTIDLAGTSLEQTLATGDIPGGQPVPVAITVDPGPLFSFGKVQIRFQGGDGQDLDPGLSTDPAFWGLKPGDAARSTLILSAESRLTALLRERGYPKARIKERVIVADHANDELDVTLTAASGPQARFGGVSVSGSEVTDADFIVQQAMIPQGEVYSPQVLETARKRLNDLGIFSSIRIVEGEVAGPDSQMPLTIEVTERKRHVIGAGASWSSSEGFGLEAYWRRRNLFGRGELLSVEGSVGRIGNENLMDMEYSARVAFDKPGAFGPLTRFTTSLGARQESPDAYTSRSLTYDAYYVREFNKHLSGRAGGKVYYANETDAFGDEDYLLVGLPADLTYDTRDDKLDPSRGIFAVLSAEPAYDTLNQNAMVFIKGTASSYLALDEARRFILAGRISAGSIVGPEVDEIPASQRFIAGGGGSIRGYAYRNVGPRLNGEVTGGRSLVELSGEVRIKATDTIGIVGFVDAGNAFTDEIPDFSQPLKIGVGAGLRYYTPIGPLRIDAAIPLDPEKDDPDFALYVGLSQAF
ncbi:membrane protein [Roseibium aquae]|uniref:Membrane protein n=1 Tax=Roseibium aquae TaxID=1323746 RepID=A0A916TKK5_9HYPH|nr:autotransporter assembly complex family protein [Roseibium aquae]GGB48960.1 membrane protein [Roseibium aquae]